MDTVEQIRHREAIAAEHLRIQASLVRCHDCKFYFRDIDDHVAKTVTVKTSPELIHMIEQVRNGYSDAV